MRYDMFDDFLAYNETMKVAVTWTTYGDDDEYFLSKAYSFEDDFLEELEDTTYTLINVSIDDNNSLEDLIEKSKSMVF